MRPLGWTDRWGTDLTDFRQGLSEKKGPSTSSPAWGRKGHREVGDLSVRQIERSAYRSVHMLSPIGPLRSPIGSAPPPPIGPSGRAAHEPSPLRLDRADRSLRFYRSVRASPFEHSITLHA